MDPQQAAIASEFDRYKDTYADTVNASLPVPGVKAELFTHGKAEYLKELAARALGPLSEVRALDFGCGVGLYTELLDATFKSLTGVDVSEKSIDAARARAPQASFRHFDGVSLPFAENAFDLAFAITVFHHIPKANWLACAKEIARTLRPGGVFAIFEHNPANPLTRRVVDRCPFDKDAVLLTGHDAAEVARAAGLEPDPPQCIFTIPAAGKYSRAIDRLFAGAGIGAQYYVCARKPAGCGR